MLYLASEMLPYIALAFVIGIIVGWFSYSPKK